MDNGLRKPSVRPADHLLTKWGIEHPAEQPLPSAANSKVPVSKPVKEEYDAEYQQELEILRQERAEVSIRSFQEELKP